MMDLEMVAVVEEMMEVAGVDLQEEGALETICARCPYREQCAHSELCFSCPAWEESMGEDI